MLTFVIPAAPGVNALYRNVTPTERARAVALGRKPPRGRRKTEDYGQWQRAAEWAMKLDGNKSRTWETITDPVEIKIINGKERLDCDAPAKAIIDLLVHMRVIPDDNHNHVRRVVLEYGGSPKEAIVQVKEFAA